MRLPIGPARLTIDKTTRAEFFLRDLAGAAGGAQSWRRTKNLGIDTKYFPTLLFTNSTLQDTEIQ